MRALQNARDNRNLGEGVASFSSTFYTKTFCILLLKYCDSFSISKNLHFCLWQHFFFFRIFSSVVFLWQSLSIDMGLCPSGCPYVHLSGGVSSRSRSGSRRSPGPGCEFPFPVACDTLCNSTQAQKVPFNLFSCFHCAIFLRWSFFGDLLTNGMSGGPLCFAFFSD